MNGWVVLAIAACAALGLSAQPGVPKPLPATLRDLEFGDINFLHTTDTHGWHAGHLLEPNYSADWGDYVDFSDRLREKAEAAGQDLLVIDTGDRIEGNGLYDGDEPKGRHTFEIFTKKHIDLICIGNHELYKQNSSENELNIIVPAYRETYIASNLDILNEDGEFVPLAQRFRKFTTPVRGLNIMAFGFIFDFQRNNNHTRINLVEDVVKEDWFQQAIRDKDIDLFVVIGHAGIRSDEFNEVYKAIRSQNWDKPIQFFGGHVHIRDAKKFDSNAYGIASGRFMETIGFQSISGITRRQHRTNGIASSPSFFRRYIDSNLYSFYHHTGLNASTFHSEKGRDVSKMIQKARKDLKLDSVYGCAPQDFWMDRVPFPSEDSLFTLLNNTIIPEIVIQPGRENVSRLTLVNTGAIRFDVFQGPFTKDSTFIVSPFTSGMHYLQDVPFDLAMKILPMINSGDQPTILDAGEVTTKSGYFDYQRTVTRRLAPPRQYSPSIVQAFTSARQDAPHNTISKNNQLPLLEKVTSSKSKLTIGYVTTDDIDNHGDDTIHDPMPFHLVPNVIQSLVILNNSNTVESTSTNEETHSTTQLPETIDLVFNEFLQPNVLSALRVLKKDYTNSDVKTYMEGENMTDMISRWIAQNWGVYCDDDDDD